MQLTYKGRVFATPSAITIVQDGVEVFSGQVGTGQSLDTELNLFQTTIPSPGTGTPPNPPQNVTQTYSVTLSVTSGVITAGDVYVMYDDGINYVMTTSGSDLRENILINGSLPEWPATPVNPMPGGTESAPDWQGWFFELAAGESMTFTFTVPAGTAPV